MHDATEDSGSANKEASSRQSGERKSAKHFDLLVRIVGKLIDKFSLDAVKKALTIIETGN